MDSNYHWLTTPLVSCSQKVFRSQKWNCTNPSWTRPSRWPLRGNRMQVGCLTVGTETHRGVASNSDCLRGKPGRNTARKMGRWACRGTTILFKSSMSFHKHRQHFPLLFMWSGSLSSRFVLSCVTLIRTMANGAPRNHCRAQESR